MASVKRRCEERALSFGLTPRPGSLTQQAKDIAFQKMREEKVLQHRMNRLNRTLAREACAGPEFKVLGISSSPCALTSRSKETTLRKLMGSTGSLDHAGSSIPIHKGSRRPQSAQRRSASAHDEVVSMLTPLSQSPSTTGRLHTQLRHSHLVDLRHSHRSAYGYHDEPSLRHRASAGLSYDDHIPQTTLYEVVQLTDEAQTAQEDWKSALSACHRLCGCVEHSQVFAAMMACAAQVDQRLVTLERTVKNLSDATETEYTFGCPQHLTGHRHLQLLNGEAGRSAAVEEALESQRTLRRELLTESHELFMCHWHSLQQHLIDAACTVMQREQGVEVGGGAETAEKKVGTVQRTMEGLIQIANQVRERLEQAGGTAWSFASMEQSDIEVRRALQLLDAEIHQALDSRVGRAEARQHAARIAQQGLDDSLTFV